MRFKALLHRLFPRHAARRIAQSPLFDDAFYLTANPDAAPSGMPPARHYLKFGAAELRDTSRAYSARSLLQLDPHFWPGWTNPVLFLEDRYMRRGRPLPRMAGTAAIPIRDVLENLDRDAPRAQAAATPATDIIVPVHNNLAGLTALLATLERNTDPRHRIIMIDDASTETGVSSTLTGFADRHPNTVLIKHTSNLGYAASVRAGLGHSANHKILLNSDTLVPPGWVDILMEPILRDPAISSVTPYSNASSYTGFPENRIELPLAGCGDLEAVNAALGQFRQLDREIVSGVGFCMAVNARALDAVGDFDDTSFKQGYFEETHWCYRAGRAGFRNVLANRLLVGHDHTSPSFGLRRKLSALRRSQARMRRAFPDYFEEMEEFYLCDPHAALRRQACLAVSCRTADRSVAVFAGRPETVSGMSFERLAAAANLAGANLLWITPSDPLLQLTAFTGRFGAIELAGTRQDVDRLLAALGVEEVYTDGSFQPGTLGNAATDPPLCIAVLGTAPLGRQPARLHRLLRHVERGNRECRVVVFGEIDEDRVSDPRISKTGIYRLDNIPALLRHHRATAVYFPRQDALSFPFVLRDVLKMGLPVLSHGRGRSSPATGAHRLWMVRPATSAEDTLAALEQLHDAYLSSLGLIPAAPAADP